jgi:hypothetical protein
VSIEGDRDLEQRLSEAAGNSFVQRAPNGRRLMLSGAARTNENVAFCKYQTLKE